MTAPFVSVVTPFHNTAEHLDECIRSVRAQVYDNFEYVLLDNVSTDGASDIAAEHARADERIRLLRPKDFVPQVQNYNRAIAAISPTAQYLKVVEADNSIRPQCLAAMVRVAEAHPSVALVGSYAYSERHLRHGGLDHRVELVAGRDLVRTLLTTDAYYFGSPTTLLVRGDIARARRPFFPEDHTYGEDLRTWYEILRTHDFGFVHDLLVFIRTENDSILGRIRGYESMALTRLILANDFGHMIDNSNERHAVLSLRLSQYYAALWRAIPRHLGPGLRSYHEEGLKTIGRRVERRRLLGEVRAWARELHNAPSATLRGMLEFLWR